MKRLTQVVALSFVLSAFAGCKDSCREMTDQVLQPTNAAQALMNTFHNGNDVASSCQALLNTLKTIPQGAQTIRDVANSKFSDSYSTCVQWTWGTRWEYQCWVEWHHEVCRSNPVQYQYCSAYEHHTTHDSGYTAAMDLSNHLDVFYAKANDLCGLAVAGNLDGAFASTRELINYLAYTVNPENDQVYALACTGN